MKNALESPKGTPTQTMMMSIARRCCVAATRAATARAAARPASKPHASATAASSSLSRFSSRSHAALQAGCPPGASGDGDVDAVTAGPESLGMAQVLFVEVGMGADQHGQDATKAAVRACRNAIEFNSIPSIGNIVPGGYANMKLHIQIGAPEGAEIDLDEVRAVFPYGNIVDPVEVCVGGLLARSGIAIPEMGDKNDDFVICVASITVGY